MTHKELIYVGVAILVFLASAFAIYAATHRPVYKRKGQLLLLNEQRFLTALIQAIPYNCTITFKVRLLDIVSVRSSNGKGMDHSLADYCVDFVVVDRETTEVKLCIEMDMESKNAAARLNKNTMISRALQRAGVPHVRLPLVRFYDPGRLRNVLNDAMASHIPAAAHAKDTMPQNTAAARA